MSFYIFYSKKVKILFAFIDFVVILLIKKGFLWEKAEKKGFLYVNIPEKVLFQEIKESGCDFSQLPRFFCCVNFT